jgi:glycine C-acetyltransferase
VFKKALTDLGFDLGVSETPITPVMPAGHDGVGLFRRCCRGRLRDGDALTVPRQARIRVMMSAAHSADDLSSVDAFDKVGRRLG